MLMDFFFRKIFYNYNIKNKKKAIQNNGSYRAENLKEKKIQQ